MVVIVVVVRGSSTKVFVQGCSIAFSQVCTFAVTSLEVIKSLWCVIGGMFIAWIKSFTMIWPFPSPMMMIVVVRIIVSFFCFLFWVFVVDGTQREKRERKREQKVVEFKARGKKIK